MREEGAQGPRPWRGPRGSRIAGALWTRSIILVQVLVFAGGIGGAVGLLRLNRGPGPRPARAAAFWHAREKQLGARLAAHPADHAAGLKLASVLLNQALIAAQESFLAAQGGVDTGEYSRYRRHIVAALRRSEQVGLAAALLRSIVGETRDASTRARAWERMASLHTLLGEERERRRCLRAAAREDPAEYRDLLENAESESRARSGAGSG